MMKHHEHMTKLYNRRPSLINLGLSAVKQVLRHGHWDVFDCPVVLVGGTNGKGSTCAYLHALCQTLGWRVGLSTSPHLHRVNERIIIDGAPIDDDFLDAVLCCVYEAEKSCNVHLTFFEILTVAAAIAFKMSPLDMVIMEVGLGGRLDACNALNPDISIITSIDLDHQAMLGYDWQSIAKEKIGIARPHRPLILHVKPLQMPWVSSLAQSMRAKCQCHGLDFNAQQVAEQISWHYHHRLISHLHLDQPGVGIDHAACAITAAIALGHRPVTTAINKTSNQIKDHFKSACRLSYYPGQPAYLLDVAHNAASCLRLAKTITYHIKHDGIEYVQAIVAIKANKAIDACLKPLIDLVDLWRPATIASDPMMHPHLITEQLQRLHVCDIAPYDTVMHHCRAAHLSAHTTKVMGKKNLIVVFGSFLTVAMVQPWVQQQQCIMHSL